MNFIQLQDKLAFMNLIIWSHMPVLAAVSFESQPQVFLQQ